MKQQNQHMHQHNDQHTDQHLINKWINIQSPCINICITVKLNILYNKRKTIFICENSRTNCEIKKPTVNTKIWMKLPLARTELQSITSDTTVRNQLSQQSLPSKQMQRRKMKQI